MNKLTEYNRPIPFLKAIARAYAVSKKDLSEYCFLFPNKRSGTFFIKYLKDELGGNKPILAPEIMTISDFVEKISGFCVASAFDLIFILFNCYKEYINEIETKNSTDSEDDKKEESGDFESFRKWGETVISDFNLIDQYLVDPDELFKNIKDFREISSNFLTDEHKEIIKKYFGQEIYESSDDFWKNFDEQEGGSSQTGKKFYHLWRMLQPLYKKFTVELERRGLCSPGGAYIQHSTSILIVVQFL